MNIQKKKATFAPIMVTVTVAKEPRKLPNKVPNPKECMTSGKHLLSYISIHAMQNKDELTVYADTFLQLNLRRTSQTNSETSATLFHLKTALVERAVKLK